MLIHANEMSVINAELSATNKTAAGVSEKVSYRYSSMSHNNLNYDSEYMYISACNT